MWDQEPNLVANILKIKKVFQKPSILLPLIRIMFHLKPVGVWRYIQERYRRRKFIHIHLVKLKYTEENHIFYSFHFSFHIFSSYATHVPLFPRFVYNFRAFTMRMRRAFWPKILRDFKILRKCPAVKVPGFIRKYTLYKNPYSSIDFKKIYPWINLVI